LSGTPFLKLMSEATVCLPESWAMSKPSILEGRDERESSFRSSSRAGMSPISRRRLARSSAALGEGEGAGRLELPLEVLGDDG
jgi:hypothetical protein